MLEQKSYKNENQTVIKNQNKADTSETFVIIAANLAKQYASLQTAISTA